MLFLTNRQNCCLVFVFVVATAEFLRVADIDRGNPEFSFQRSYLRLSVHLSACHSLAMRSALNIEFVLFFCNFTFEIFTDCCCCFYDLRKLKNTRKNLKRFRKTEENRTKELIMMNDNCQQCSGHKDRRTDKTDRRTDGLLARELWQYLYPAMTAMTTTTTSAPTKTIQVNWICETYDKYDIHTLRWCWRMMARIGWW